MSSHEEPPIPMALARAWRVDAVKTTIELDELLKMHAWELTSGEVGNLQRHATILTQRIVEVERERDEARAQLACERERCETPEQKAAGAALLQGRYDQIKAAAKLLAAVSGDDEWKASRLVWMNFNCFSDLLVTK